MIPAIRMASPADASEVLAIYAPFVVKTSVSFETDPPSIEEVARRISTTLPEFPWLVCEYDGRLVGYAYAGRFRARPAYRWTVETAVYVRDGFHGQRVGTAIYSSLLACLRLQGLRTAVAGITLPNEASARLHQRLGFQLVGVFHHVGHKLGVWHDVAWWERTLQELPEPPPEPLRCAQAVNTPRWSEAIASGQLQIRV